MAGIPRSRRRDLAELILGYGAVVSVIWMPEHWQRILSPAVLLLTLLVVVAQRQSRDELGLGWRGLVPSLWILPAAIALAALSMFAAARFGVLHPLYKGDFAHISGYVLWTIYGNYILDIPKETCDIHCMEHIKTLQQAIIHFKDFENCRKLMMELRWPDGKVTCPHCGSEKVSYLAKTRVWKCYSGHPRPTFSLKTGTVLEESPVGLDKWLPALWLVVNCKNGISSCELAKDLGVTQKTAWFMAHRLRFALTEGGFSLLCGEVEADETFIGGKARNMQVAQRRRRITGTGT